MAGTRLEPRSSFLRGWEFSLGIDRFIELHGDVGCNSHQQEHVRDFVKRRSSSQASSRVTSERRVLPELVRMSREHPGTILYRSTPIQVATCLQACLTGHAERCYPDRPLGLTGSDAVEGSRSKRRPGNLRSVILVRSPIYVSRRRTERVEGEAAYCYLLLALSAVPD